MKIWWDWYTSAYVFKQDGRVALFMPNGKFLVDELFATKLT